MREERGSRLGRNRVRVMLVSEATDENEARGRIDVKF